MVYKTDNAVFIIKSYHRAQLIRVGAKYKVQFKYDGWIKQFKEIFISREKAIQFIKSLGFTAYETKFDKYSQIHYLTPLEKQKQWDEIYRRYHVNINRL